MTIQFINMLKRESQNLLLLILCVSAAILFHSYAAEAIERHKWKNRPLLVFAPTNSDSRLIRQNEIINKNWQGLSERDMVVILVVGSDVKSVLGKVPNMSARELRARYDVRVGEFRSILIGKDGGVKLSSSPPLSVRDLFSVIDQMPMRRREMKQTMR